MQQRNILIIGAAIFLGLVAVYLANEYFSGVETKQAQIAADQQSAQIVVATQDLAFGTPLSAQNVKLVAWPARSVPEGAFTTLQQATTSRVALRPIVVGEPVLASKVSGTDGRATLSANLPVGQVAYAIPINDTGGVGGFVRPGDTVDVLLTRQIPGDGAQSYDKMTDVVLEAVQVLGIDQVADEKQTNPAVGKTATLQVDTFGAQKLALSTQIGVMSLALRNVADIGQGYRKTVTRRDISQSRLYIGARNTLPAPVAAPVRMAVSAPLRPVVSGETPNVLPSGPTMTVVRGTKPTEEEVLRGY